MMIGIIDLLSSGQAAAKMMRRGRVGHDDDEVEGGQISGD